MRKAILIGTLALSSLLGAKDIATVGSQAVSEQDFGRAIQAAEAKAGQALGPQARQELLQAMIRQRLLVAEARSRRWDKEEGHRAAMAELERQRLAERLYGEEVLAKSQVSDEEAQAILAKEPRSFDRVQLSQLLLAGVKGQEAALEAEARQLAKSLAKDPKRFAAKAKDRSDDKLSSPRGGDLGELGPHQVLPELGKAAFAAKAPAVVGPVQTQFGWHILYVRKLSRSAWPKDAVRIKDQIRAVRAQGLEAELMERLAKAHKVSIKETQP